MRIVNDRKKPDQEFFRDVLYDREVCVFVRVDSGSK